MLCKKVYWAVLAEFSLHNQIKRCVGSLFCVQSDCIAYSCVE